MDFLKKKIELLHFWQMRIQHKGDEFLNSMFLPIIKKRSNMRQSLTQVLLGVENQIHSVNILLLPPKYEIILFASFLVSVLCLNQSTKLMQKFKQRD